MKRNKIILSLSSLFCTSVYVFFIVRNTKYIGEFSFRYLTNESTGEKSSVLATLFVYLVAYVFGTAFFASFGILFCMYVYFLLRHKEADFYNRKAVRTYESELDYAARLTWKLFFACAFVFLGLHLSRVIDIF